MGTGAYFITQASHLTATGIICALDWRLRLDSSTWFHGCVRAGIINEVRGRPPAALTETGYLEHFISLQSARGVQISLMGFSAGSMLAIAMAHRATVAPSLKRCVVAAVAIHGPDKIRSVFEAHQAGLSRLDIFFSYSLYRTMIQSGSSWILPPGHGGGLHSQILPWRTGWEWMKAYTEATFYRPWMQMEDEWWSCHRAMEHPMGIVPVYRIIARNDPIVSYEHCFDKALFANLSVVEVNEDGGHCAAFRHNAGLAGRILRWHARIGVPVCTSKRNAAQHPVHAPSSLPRKRSPSASRATSARSRASPKRRR
jgi:hypothetical protein